MNILLLGSGGREHALAWKMNQSPLCNRLFIAPGNAGTAQCGTNLNFADTDFETIKSCIREYYIDLVVVGAEQPLVKGIYDYLKSDPELERLLIIAPSQAGAMLEGSKDFAKQFMKKHNIQTAAYQSFTSKNIEDGFRFLETLTPPYVLKADGLAAGKGVLILPDLKQAKAELEAMLLQDKFGEASKKVVIEQFLDGVELSVFVLTDGNSYKILPVAKDYKRIGEGNTGLNTGGMGAVSPVLFADECFMQKVENNIIKPTINGLQEENIIYQGFIFFGLINVGGEPYVIEYNVRMGDPETESIIPRIDSDLVFLLEGIAKRRLHEHTLKINARATATVMLVSGGYPEEYVKGKVITDLPHNADTIIFHAGTANAENGDLITSGGRVLALTSFGQNIEEAVAISNAAAQQVCFEGKYFRRDIGQDLIE